MNGFRCNIFLFIKAEFKGCPADLALAFESKTTKFSKISLPIKFTVEYVLPPVKSTLVWSIPVKEKTLFLKLILHLSSPRFLNKPFTTVLTPNNVVAKPSPLGELKARNSTCSLFNLAKQFKELPATFAEFNSGLAQLKKQGAQTLVLDLRDNGGGYMEEAIAIADHFLKDNDLIVFTKSKSGTIEKTFATEKGN